MALQNSILQQLKEKIIEFHNPFLANEEGMVYQIWNDGEITLQKSGSLLWRRNLHTIELGLSINFQMPETYGDNSFAYVNRDNANELRKLFISLSKLKE